MVSRTLARTKSATFAVLIPHPKPEYKGFPTPNGTGFFVSEDGYFITARHVLLKKDASGKVALQKPTDIQLMKPEIIPSPFVSNISIMKEWPNYDLILLKADFDKNKDKDVFQGKKGFAF